MNGGGPIELEPTDLFLTRVKGGGWISSAIERATKDDDLVTFTHCAGVIFRGDASTARLLEMTWPRGRLIEASYYTAADSGNRWMALRIPSLTVEQREAVVERAREYLGRLYPLGKLGLQLLDLTTGSRFFTRALGMQLLEVCSGLWARALKDGAGWYFRDDHTGKTLDPESVRPDDIHDHAVRWPNEIQAIAGSL